MSDDKPRLTRRQREVFDFINQKIKERGYGPTVREIGAEFGIRSPNGVMCHLQALVKKGLITREPNMSRAITVVGRNWRSGGIPLAGAIAAGKPIETYEESEQVDFGEMFTKDNLFALKVRGQSMIEDHIDDGDYVVIRKQETAANGERVVAMIDNEVTLKKFYRDGEMIRLEPANGTMGPILVPPGSDAQILGVLVGVLRRC